MIWLAAGLLVIAVFAAYANTLRVPFLYDDPDSILHNPSIRQLWPLWDVLVVPQQGITASGRPLLNLSLALNYAISGPEVWSYHLLNTLIHAGAGLALFGLVRRTLQTPLLAARYGAHALPLALSTALLWALHPLQTESVTYTVQRAESLCGLFYILTFYCFVRGVSPVASTRWLGLALAACFCGMASKEVMVTAPVLVLLYDRTFLAGSFLAALRSRRTFYLGLASSWLLLGACLLSTGGNRGGAIGFGSGISWWSYGLTQFEAITRYLALSFWPSPLVFDYGTFWVQSVTGIIAPALVVFALLAAVIYALVRRPLLGFAGAVFFAILAPTSLVPGTTQMIVEHRLYLSLAAVATLVPLALYAPLRAHTLTLCLALGLALGVTTFRRNEVYRTEISVWADTAVHRPLNAFAHYNLGTGLLRAGRTEEAIVALRETLRLKPAHYDARQNLANALYAAGRVPEAIQAFEEMLPHSPAPAEVHGNLSLALLRVNRGAEALAHARQAVQLAPATAAMHLNLANTLAQTDHLPEAAAAFERALQLDPSLGFAHLGFGHVLLSLSRRPEALAHFEQAVRLLPDFAPARAALEQARAHSP